MNDSSKRKLRVLTFTTLYPNQEMQHHGIFVEQRLRKLLAHGDVISRVVAPVPWVPFNNSILGKYATFAAIPKSETLREIKVVHPRYLLMPKIGMSTAPILMALGVYRMLKKYSLDSTGYDIIDAHYFYPDGVAATILGAWLSKPVIITARGTDVNWIPKYYVPRKWILWAAKRCAKIITVSDALRDQLKAIGVDPSGIQTLRNGVDLELFRPLVNREDIRRELNISGKTLLSVGHLIERKGHHLVIEALSKLPDVNLIIIGDGPMRNMLIEIAHKHGVEDRVKFEGTLSHEQLTRYYNASDALILASSREGMANVLLESIACGTPVVATPYWGNPEVIADRRAGVLTEDRTADAIVAAMLRLIQNCPAREEVREYAEMFSWEATTRGQIDIFIEALGR